VIAAFGWHNLTYFPIGRDGVILMVTYSINH
jgi:hypothetical protein